jgi:hypothetical protein
MDALEGRISALNGAELSALVSAGAWYAKYHAAIIAERADDQSAYAVAERERYQDLVEGLRKLGLRIPDPVALPVEAARAA